VTATGPGGMVKIATVLDAGTDHAPISRDTNASLLPR
jgi:hypothetical protein